MINVIGGNFKRLVLKTLKGLDTRPTSNKLKETIFNLIQSKIIGCYFLDCFAGSGNIGIEALSRGASTVIFIESSQSAANIIQNNLYKLSPNYRQKTLLLKKPVELALQILKHRKMKFDIVFVDPPYAATKEYYKVFSLLDHFEILSDSACVIVEHSKGLILPEQLSGLSRLRSLKSGNSKLSLYSPL